MSSRVSPLEQKVRVFALVGDSTRIRILQLLAHKRQVNVSDIAKELGMQIACISHHLQLLKDNRLVMTKRQGNSIFYRLAGNQLMKKIILFIQ